MTKVKVIESVIRPGSFWSISYEEFKGYNYATYYYQDDDKELISTINRISKGEPCKVTEIYIK